MCAAVPGKPPDLRTLVFGGRPAAVLGNRILEVSLESS